MFVHAGACLLDIVELFALSDYQSMEIKLSDITRKRLLKAERLMGISKDAIANEILESFLEQAIEDSSFRTAILKNIKDF